MAGTIAKQSPDLLENLAGMIGGTGQLADTGKNALSSLLGGGTFSSLSSDPPNRAKSVPFIRIGRPLSDVLYMSCGFSARTH
jgi:hypothetical protein